MNNPFMYPCIAHLMMIFDQKERATLIKKPYYHANLVLNHFA